MNTGAKVIMNFLRLGLLSIFTMLIVAMIFPSTAWSETRTYTAEDLDYVLVLPSARWRSINGPGIDSEDTEFRYDNGDAVHLRIRRELVNAEVTVADLIQRRQTLDRAVLLGYVKEKIEPFDGHLSGARYAYEYVTDGKPTARLIYYLEANNRIIYRLEFAGSLDRLRQLSDQTDFIARSFQLK